MSGIIHSIRTLFSSPSAEKGMSTRSRVREQREEEDGEQQDPDDDDVFSTFGDDAPETQTEEANTTQPPHDDDIDIDEEANTQKDSAVDYDQNAKQHSESTRGTAAGQQSLATQMSTMDDDDDDDQEESTATTAAASKNSGLSPLIEFFAHVTDGRKEGESLERAYYSNERSMSLKDWKKARKTIILNYLTRRLFPDSDSEDVNSDGDGYGDDYDDCSFTSEVLDEPFGTRENETKANNNDSNVDHVGESEDEDEDDGMHLETQPPQTATEASEFGGQVNMHEEEEEEEEEGSSLLKTQSQEVVESESEEAMTPNTRSCRDEGIFSGIKRKLGFATSASDQPGEEEEEEEDTSQKSDKEQEQKLPKRARRNENNKPPRMWDGRFGTITHVDDASRSCSKLEELDLSSKSLNLSLCRVLRKWDLRSTRRIDKRMSYRQQEGIGSDDDGVATAKSSEDTLHPNIAMTPYEFCEDDGPLNTLYRRVFSIEIVQIIDDETQGEPPTLSPSVTNIAAAAFRDGKLQLDKETTRKNRHAVRRVRVFFYDMYADAMASAFDDLWQQSPEKKRVVHFLLSLANVPAVCILPLAIASKDCHPYLQQYINNPFGDAEDGALSPYCICIGDRSAIEFGAQNIYFDCDELEIRLVEAPMNRPLEDIGENNDFVLDDAVITAASGQGYFREGNQSDLVKRYVELGKRASMPEPITFNPDDEEEMSDNNAGAAPNPGFAGLSNIVENAGQPTAFGESAAGSGIARPQSIVPLCNLRPLLARNSMKNLNITVYGVVLGFSPPSLTRTQEWMMSIVLIDDTLPLSTEAQGQSNTGDSGDNNNPKDTHVPSVTLMLFNKDKSKLPVIRSAGDVLCCEKVVLQVWSGEPQLCGRKFSKIVTVHPRQPRCPGNELHDSASPNDWSASCACHDSNGEIHSTLKLAFVNSLWRWGQQRLSMHPTMSPNCYLSIAEVGDHNGNLEVSVSGDLTAAVTDIMPVPEHLRRRDTPRGYIRIWDGTGPSRSDPLPLNIAADISNQQRGDPPEQVLAQIEKIISGTPNEELTIQAPLALCGRVINAMIWEENLWTLIHRENIIHIGSFIRLRNINNAKLPTRTNCFSVHSKSSLTPLPFDAYEVKGLLKDHGSRIQRGVPPNPASAILPARSRSTPDIVAQELRNNGLSMIKDCLQKPPPASFTTQFEVSNTIPACNLNSIDAIKVLCTKKRDGTASFRFALHIKDASAEMDVICIGQVAEDLLGIKPQDIIERSEKCEAANKTLKELMASGSTCEGKIRSVVGKDGKLWFILKSMFCITAETV